MVYILTANLPLTTIKIKKTNPSLTFDMSKYGHRKLKTEYEKQLQNYYA